MQINTPRGSAESYRVSVKDRNGKLLNLTGWTATVTLKVNKTDTEPVFEGPCAVDPSDSRYVLVPIEGEATASARKLVGYVEVTAPAGKPVDGIEFTLTVEEHA